MDKNSTILFRSFVNDLVFKKIQLKNLSLIFLILFAAKIGFSQNVDGNFRTRQSGNFSDVTTWQFRSAGSWANAISVPGVNDTIMVRAGHTLTINNNVTINSFYLNSAGVIACGNQILSVSGSIYCFGGVAFSGNTEDTISFSQTVSNGNVTCTTNGRLKFIGGERNITRSGSWSANGLTTSAIVDFSLNANDTGRFNSGFKANTIIINSGIIDLQTNRLSLDNNVSGGGTLTINGGTLLSAATGATSGTRSEERV